MKNILLSIELIKHPKTKFEYLDTSVQNILLNIEILEDKWVLQEIPFDHTYGRVPGETEIRFWSIPRNTGQFLHSLVSLQKPNTILEIGSSVGYSSIWLASAAKKYGGQIYTCEILPEKIKLLRENINSSKLSNVHIIEGDARNQLKKFSKEINFIFLDADKENYVEYWKLLQPLVKPGAILIADNAVDYAWLVKDFLNVVKNDSTWESLILPFDNGLLIAVKL